VQKRQAAVAFVLVTVFLDALAFAIVIPVIPDLVKEIGRVPPAQASFWVGALLTGFAMVQFFAAPVLGAVSDRYGRRPVLLICLTILGLSSLATVFVQSLAGLVLIRMLAGLASGDIPAAVAYIADITPPAGRAKQFGLVGAMFGLGFVAGPGLGGLLGGVWLRLPFAAAAGLSAANVLYGIFVLPESLAPENRRNLTWRDTNPFSALRAVFVDGKTLRLGFAWCCTWFALGAQQSSFILANEMRFHWTVLQNGLVLALSGVCGAVTQSVLVGRVIGRFGLRGTALIGALFSAAGYAGYAMAGSIWILFFGIVVLSLGMVGSPAVRSMLSQSVDARRQGEVQGALSGLQALMSIAAPVTMGALFAGATMPGAGLHFPGAPFLLAALVCLASFAVLSKINVAAND
jgi:DHA1 family tetracycline resistance protein-like MFS transporter